MGIVAFLFVIISNLITVLLRKRSKIIVALSIAILAILMGFSSTVKGDSYWYSMEYYGQTTLVGDREFGFNFLMSFFSGLGIPFEAFRIIIFLVCILLMYYGLKKHIYNYHQFLLFYSVSFYYFLAIALNFFLAISVIIFAMQFLFKKRIIPYVALVAFASIFHSAALYALLFLAVLLPNKILFRSLGVILAINILLVVFMAVNTSSISGIAMAYQRFLGRFLTGGSSYLVEYVTVGYSRSSIRYIVFYLINIGLQYGIFNKCRDKLQDESELAFLAYGMKISLISSVFLPLMVFTITMIRLLFIPLIICFTTYQILLKYNIDGFKLSTIKIKASSVNLLCHLSVMIWLVFYLRHELGFDLIYFLSNNTLI